MTRELSSLGVPAGSVGAVVHVVGEALGKEIVGKLDARTVRRCDREGGIYADIQIADAMNQAAGITISGDGTTHRHRNYESKNITAIAANGEHEDLFLGIDSAPSHTSDEQLRGWMLRLEAIANAWNATPAGRRNPIDPRTFAAKFTGMHTDHAEDQKKLCRLVEEYKTACAREIRGKNMILEMPSDEVLALLWTKTHETITALGGHENWQLLSDEERERHHKEMLKSLHRELGDRGFALLSSEDQQKETQFVWVGCSMHKELNAVKGGNTAMVGYWVISGIPGPRKLMNRDNAAAAAEPGPSAAKLRAIETSIGGAIKATSLAGAVFNHKDDKKGQQDTFRWFFVAMLGYAVDFPDTSNTRYQSHCEAASELLVHLPLYKELLALVKDKKDSRALNHMEQNLWDALHDAPTLQELSVLALYSQSISHPYLRRIRSPNVKDMNALHLGLLHHQVITHCEAIIENPYLLVSETVSHETGAMDGQPWERPEVVYKIQLMSAELPHLKPLLVAFFQGALQTWRRFSAEYAVGGKIASLTASQRKLSWMHPTNDRNEGALGTLRVDMRASPNGTLSMHNAKAKYKKNKTGLYIKQVGNADLDKHVRQTARQQDQSGLEAARKKEGIEHDRVEVQKKRDKDTQKRQAKEAIMLMEVITDRVRINKMTRAELDTQIKRLRLTDPKIPRAKDMPRRAERLKAVLEAVKRYEAEVLRQQSSSSAGIESPIEQENVSGEGLEDEDEMDD
ncbi:hypothetical protein SISNIDRAFT_426536, partial [Sistotremastrum niveocremeum HHB9708]